MEIQLTSKDKKRIEKSILGKYAKVAISPENLFKYPTGLAGLRALNYDPEIIQTLPDRIEAFLRPEKIEEAFRVADRTMNDELLVKDNGPGDHGEINENQQDQLDDRAGVKYQIQGISPYAYLLLAKFKLRLSGSTSSKSTG